MALAAASAVIYNWVFEKHWDTDFLHLNFCFALFCLIMSALLFHRKEARKQAEADSQASAERDDWFKRALAHLHDDIQTAADLKANRRTIGVLRSHVRALRNFHELGLRYGRGATGVVPPPREIGTRAMQLHSLIVTLFFSGQCPWPGRRRLPELLEHLDKLLDRAYNGQ